MDLRMVLGCRFTDHGVVEEKSPLCSIETSLATKGRSIAFPSRSLYPPAKSSPQTLRFPKSRRSFPAGEGWFLARGSPWGPTNPTTCSFETLSASQKPIPTFAASGILPRSWPHSPEGNHRRGPKERWRHRCHQVPPRPGPLHGSTPIALWFASVCPGLPGPGIIQVARPSRQLPGSRKVLGR